MSIEKEISSRSNGACELCGSTNDLKALEVAPIQNNGRVDDFVHVCSTCSEQISNPDKMDANHWRCLNDSMWSETPAVQVIAWRMLNRLKSEGWPQDLLDMLYLDEEKLAWAKATGDHDNDGTVDLHLDCNGQQLFAGDSVVLTKSLDVKGTSLNAKMGTVVKNIRLVPDNTEQIEGKIEGQMIVILTKYVRKA